jgi:hypothetical protein
MYSVIEQELEVAGLRERLCAMSDEELLRFGWAARCVCARENPRERGPQSFVLRLHEAREEWNRRKPGLPLRDSF